MIITAILSVILSILLIVYFFASGKYSYWSKRNVPFMNPIFPYGNLKGVGSTVHLAFVTKKMYDKFIGKFLFVGMYFFFRPVAIILDPNLIKNVLVKDFHYFQDRGLYVNEKIDPMSGHLFSLEGTRWKNLRAKLTPTFSSGKMKLMFNTVLAVSQELKRYLKKSADVGETIEIKDILSRFTTDVIGSCAFGIDCNSIKDPDAEFLKMGRKVFNPGKFQQIHVLFVSTFPGLATKLGLSITEPDVATFFLRIVKETVEFRESNVVDRQDFMQLLLQLKNGDSNVENLTLNELAAQCFLFFLAGYETSSTTMTYFIYEMALNLEIQEKAREEIKRVFEKHNRKITYDFLLELPYLDMVVNETLRKYPTIDSLIRTAGKDYPIEGSDLVVEKGTFVMLPVYSIHHDHNIYPEPEKFIPERFTPENIQTRHPYTFLPFGEGPRACIGIRFGIMQVRLGIISILLNYKITPTEKTQRKIKFLPNTPVMNPEGGIYVKIENL